MADPTRRSENVPPDALPVSLSAPPKDAGVRLRNTALFVALVGLAAYTAADTQVSLSALVQGFPYMGRLFVAFFSPDFADIARYVPALAETIQMAVAGTLIGSLLALGYAFLAARNFVTHRGALWVTRGFMNLVRTIPDLLFAALFVAVFGIGALSGILALIFFSFGIVAKLTSETIEAADMGPAEALYAAGATPAVAAVYAVLPQILPQYLSYVLYVFEINVRVSTVLGLVGAGGIGVPLKAALNLLQYDRASAILLLVFLAVLLIEWTSQYLRRRLTEGESPAAPSQLGGVFRRFRGPIAFLGVAAALVWSFWGIDLNTKGFSVGAQMAGRILAGIFRPEWSYAPELLVALWESVEIAYLGTLLAAVLALPFGFWAARNVTPAPFAAGTKVFLSAVRTFPELMLAIVFMVGVGPGAYAGILAVGVHSIGMLAKLYGEAVEAMDMGPVEALRAAGADGLGVFRWAIFPQVLPELLSYAIYRFEINMRAATVVGVVGAGGIGAPLLFALQSHAWERAGIILLGIVVLVSLTDALSGAVRRRLV
ncbi:MAG: Phosphonate ABC transporter permease protein phnE1 [Brockia lithotrophica]|uniref:Phosphonate ABC transporter permease protein phnE1 n=1 Tax=Brockia lithotrophica TaxID=933949 RepID=A0A2T5G5F8_9BACL|nr:phosphonate ABC transporter, permease protein PhnE [Brockia lithotrophica]PTQ51408.1 MAG: Phosphonate ABC transporter permease protein phnE1 [Brockia lithotrophica]